MPSELNEEVVKRHLNGEITIGLYAMNPATQRCKWLALDADHEKGIEDLLRIQHRLSRDGIESALEMSRRGGHLWMFFAAPVLAKRCRGFIQQVCLGLGVPIKVGDQEGIEVFPKHDTIASEEFGSAMRGPLGIHRAVGRRFWFYGAEHTLSAQIQYLSALRKVTDHELEIGTLPKTKEKCRSSGLRGKATRLHPEFRILEHVVVVRRSGRNYVARCPSCAQSGRDRNRDNLAILVENPRFYKCWAGCSKDMIRTALNRPLAARR